MIQLINNKQDDDLIIIEENIQLDSITLKGESVVLFVRKHDVVNWVSGFKEIKEI